MNVLIVLVASFLGTALAEEWNYITDDAHGPSHWGGVCQTGKKQSPIDVDSSDVTYDAMLSTLKLTGYDVTFDLQMINNGHTVQCNIVQGQTLPNVSGGKLPGAFNLQQFHFHWGADDSAGSEHTVDGMAYPLEVHMVHTNEKYTTGEQILGNDDGGTVLGFFFEIGDTDNTNWAPVLDHVDKVKYAGQTHNLAGVNINTLLGDMTDFYRYNGGLTTPNCSQVITWNVFKKTIKISRSQMDKFRDIYKTAEGATDGKKIKANYRPIQDLNTRSVTSSKEMQSPSASSSRTITMNILLVLTALAFAFAPRW